jgi:SAM-dependent methyltransferase
MSLFRRIRRFRLRQNAWKINRFGLWRIYRSRIVPALLVLSLLSIIFGGALLAEGLDPKAFNTILFRNLFAASLLMVVHGIYLGLMAYHLVYRFPIERQQWIGCAFAFIFFAYFAHARHAYLHATRGHGWLEAGWWSMAAFALTYVAMVAHGLVEWRRESRNPVHGESRRPSYRKRRDWMLGTDIFMSGLTLLLFGIGAEIVPGFPTIESFAANMVDGLGKALAATPVLQTLTYQASPKDIAIACALVGYVFAKQAATRQHKDKQRIRSREMLKHTRIDDESTKWMEIEQALTPYLLKEGRIWLDLGCGTGTQLRELFLHLYLAENRSLPLPSEVIFLDKDVAAIADLRRESTKWMPATIKPEFAPTDMCLESGLQHVARSDVIHLSHVAYSSEIAQDVVFALRSARPGTLLLVRFSSGASVYRVISASASCAPFRPYIHHEIHRLLLQDLEPAWKERSKHLLARYYDIANPEATEHLTDWCDSQYGEFSGDVIERYVVGLLSADQTQVLNSDRLVVLQKLE